MTHASIAHSRSLQKRKRLAKIAAISFIFCAVFITAGAAVLSHVNVFELQRVLISGAKATDHSDLEQQVWDEMQGRYAFLFSKKNTFIFPKRSIAASVLDAFPGLKDAAVEFADYHTIRLTVEERNPVALWCGAEAGSSTPCYFLDEGGLVFAEAPTFSGGLYTRFFGDLEASEGSPIRARFMPEKYEALKQFLDALKERGFSAKQAVVDAKQDVAITAKNDTILLFVVSDQYDAALRDFSLILTTLESKGISPESLKTVDMRFPGKAFYLLREE